MTDLPSSDLIIYKKNPWIAFFLTLLFPGLGHLYIGHRFAAMVYGAMSLGVWATYFSSRSFATQIAVLLIYPFVVIPAARDAVDTARGKKKPVTGEESWIYVVWMLCCVGPFALPLLWQNKKMTLTVKVVWTVIVLSVVVLFFATMAFLGRVYHEVLG